MLKQWILPEIDLNLCTACGQCAVGCPENALDMTAVGPQFTRPQNCTFCTQCESLCPEGAIRCELEIVWNQNSR